MTSKTPLHLSIFRYPGGKSWLLRYVEAWLKASPVRLFVEPFAGGASVSLAVAHNRWAAHVLMCEMDPDVGAVWNAVLNGDAGWLKQKVSRFDLTRANLARELAGRSREEKRIAFRTLLRNRTAHGGLLTAGSAPLRRGERGRGIKSRWYPDTLAKRIAAIEKIRHRITFVEGDGVSLFEGLAGARRTAFFLDPPYAGHAASAGKRLYRFHAVNHYQLFGLANRTAGDFMMTYEDTPEVRLLVKAHGFEFKKVKMRTRHHVEATELIICRDFSWWPRSH